MPDVVEQGQHEVRPRPGDAGERRRRRRVEEDLQVARPGEEVVESDRQQGPGRVAVPLDHPLLARLDEQPLALEGHLGALGHVDEGQGVVVAEQEDLLPVERDGADHEVALEARRPVVVGGDVQVVRLALEDDGRVGQRGPARPPAHRAGVAGRRHGPRAQVGVDEHRVRVDPAEAALGLRADEAVGHPLERLEVELARDVGVRAAAGERHQRPAEVRPPHLRAVPHPALALGGAQRVEVEQRLPRGVVGAVLLERGASPQPALVLGVAPEVVQVVAGAADHRDLGVGVEDLEHLPADLGEAGALGEAVQGVGVALAHPGQRVRALDVLEPCIGVGVHAPHHSWAGTQGQTPARRGAGLARPPAVPTPPDAA